jgi:hypothetical protein
MTLENVFYTVGIFFFLLNIILLLGIVFILLYIRKKVTDVSRLIEEKVDMVTSRPVEVATGLGVSLADFLFKRAAKSARKK